MVFGFWLEGLAYQAPRSVVQVNGLVCHGQRDVWAVLGAWSFEEEHTCMSYEEEGVWAVVGACIAMGLGFWSFEEEDTCMSYEEEDTCLQPFHVI
jgi:hypothetical protein